MTGPLSSFFVEDHRRLDRLLARSVAEGRVEAAPYEDFRAGILRHIGMEERVLLPAARRARGGTALPVARLLRLDHGAIAALMVPPPTVELVGRIAAVLGPHNEVEERSDGLYAVCDDLLAGEADALLGVLRGYPAVPLASHQDGPKVHRHIEEALRLARKAWADEDPSRRAAAGPSSLE